MTAQKLISIFAHTYQGQINPLKEELIVAGIASVWSKYLLWDCHCQRYGVFSAKMSALNRNVLRVRRLRGKLLNYLSYRQRKQMVGVWEKHWVSVTPLHFHSHSHSHFHFHLCRFKLPNEALLLPTQCLSFILAQFLPSSPLHPSLVCSVLRLLPAVKNFIISQIII